MRILHTSDWHLGATLCDRPRFPEHKDFLTWLSDLIHERGVEVLLVAGDIFDTASPSNRAQNLYFDFLRSLRSSCCRHVIITGGNHDSPSLLDAAAGYLGQDGIHVLGCARRDEQTREVDPGREVLPLTDSRGEVGLVVCAVPFLRDRDVRVSGFGQSTEERSQGLVQGILKHYEVVAGLARTLVAGRPRPCPVVAMGHLFARGSAVRDGEDGLVVGTLGEVEAGPLATLFDYTALGHIHSSQIVGCDRVRYSGSPLAMSFGERNRKSVLIVDFEEGDQAPAPGDGGPGVTIVPVTPSGPNRWQGFLRIESVPVPVWRELVHLEGSVDELEDGLRALVRDRPGAWAELDLTGSMPVGDWRERLTAAAGTGDQAVEILRIRDTRPIVAFGAESGLDMDRSLAELTPGDIFALKLDEAQVAEEDRAWLTELFEETLAHLDELAEDSEDADGAEPPVARTAGGTTGGDGNGRRG